MTFTSLNFLLFFPILLVVYNFITNKYKSLFLLFSSYFIYLFIKPIFILLLLFVTLSTYISTRLIDKESSDYKKLLLMRLNIFLVLLPLFFFKYFIIINSGLIYWFNSMNLFWPLPEIKYFLPIGISFYTFMAIGYTIDVYNEDLKSEKNIISVALFLSFFPIILSGPIERASNIFPKINNLDYIKIQNLTKGAKLILWGYFMKLCVADRLGIYIDTIFENVSNHNGNSLALASFLYPFQLYSDLGGYSLLAIGTSQCLGITIIPNFRRPFFSKSMSEFWRKWHMSLIQWLTDYLYTPLVYKFRKRKIYGVILALMLTFIISGLWHGASLVFIAWGFIQGVYLSVEAFVNYKKLNILKNIKFRFYKLYLFISILFTFFLFSFSQIFAKSNSINESLIIIIKIFTNRGKLFIDENSLIYGILFLFVLLIKDFKDEYYSRKFEFYENKNIVIRFLSYLITLIIIIAFGTLDSGEFIYFKY